MDQLERLIMVREKTEMALLYFPAVEFVSPLELTRGGANYTAEVMDVTLRAQQAVSFYSYHVSDLIAKAACCVRDGGYVLALSPRWYGRRLYFASQFSFFPTDNITEVLNLYNDSRQRRNRELLLTLVHRGDGFILPTMNIRPVPMGALAKGVGFPPEAAYPYRWHCWQVVVQGQAHVARKKGQQREIEDISPEAIELFQYHICDVFEDEDRFLKWFHNSAFQVMSHLYSTVIVFEHQQPYVEEVDRRVLHMPYPLPTGGQVDVSRLEDMEYALG